MAAPATPMPGIPLKPKIKSGSKTIFTTHPKACNAMGTFMLPIA